MVGHVSDHVVAPEQFDREGESVPGVVGISPELVLAPGGCDTHAREAFSRGMP